MEAARRKRQETQAPRTLEEALSQGWTVHEDLAGWHFNGSNRREGYFLLKKKGSGETRTLVVRSMALYELGAPYFLDAWLQNAERSTGKSEQAGEKCEI
jgi:hypothetical protein